MGDMTETTTCAIVGGGPAGMVLGLLLARAACAGDPAGEARRLPARLPWRHRASHHAATPRRARALGALCDVVAQRDPPGQPGCGRARRHRGRLRPVAAPAAPLRCDGAAVGPAQPACRIRADRADVHLADADRSHRAAARGRSGGRSALPRHRRYRRTACRSHGGLRRALVGRAARGRLCTHASFR